ncbi:unnamed protein product [Moneuplotes crassus]|uniref:Uncharacterized protein n=1 Tax=Euplotes crassus TaxID=5936 RepID=A0AAD1XVV5_EUPCR|nr:unnamed protein product [Moneuplotes crassus]
MSTSLKAPKQSRKLGKFLRGHPEVCKMKMPKHMGRSRFHANTAMENDRDLSSSVLISSSPKQNSNIRKATIDYPDRDSIEQDSILKDFKMINSIQRGNHSSIPDFLDVSPKKKSYWSLFYRQLFPEDCYRQTLLKKIIVKTASQDPGKLKRDYAERTRSLDPMLHGQDSVCKSTDMEELNISRLLEYRRNNSCRKTRQKTLTKSMLDSHILKKKLRLAVKEPRQRRLKKLEFQNLDSFKRSESVIQEGLQTPVLSESKRRKQSGLSKPSSPPQLKAMSLTKKFEMKGSFFVSSNLSQFCNKKNKDMKSVDSSNTEEIRKFT